MVYMNDTPPQKISVSLAVEAIVEASERVRELEDATEDARAVRDALIRDAHTSIGTLRLARIAKLSRETIYRITHSGD